MGMTVRVLSIEPIHGSTDDHYAATYVVRAEVDARAYTFQACVELADIGARTIQCANLCDSQSKELFRWRQNIPPRINTLVLAVYNKKLVTFPVDVSELWPVAQSAARA